MPSSGKFTLAEFSKGLYTLQLHYIGGLVFLCLLWFVCFDRFLLVCKVWLGWFVLFCFVLFALTGLVPFCLKDFGTKKLLLIKTFKYMKNVGLKELVT